MVRSKRMMTIGAAVLAFVAGLTVTQIASAASKRPQGGGGKSILGIVLSIAVLAAGAWAGFGIAALPGVVGALGSTGASILGGVVTGVIPTPGKLLIARSITW